MNFKESKLLKEILRKPNLQSVIKSLNHYNNIVEYYKEGIDLELVLIEVTKEMVNRKIRIPSGGYINLLARMHD